MVRACWPTCSPVWRTASTPPWEAGKISKNAILKKNDSGCLFLKKCVLACKSTLMQISFSSIFFDVSRHWTLGTCLGTSLHSSLKACIFTSWQTSLSTGRGVYLHTLAVGTPPDLGTTSQVSVGSSLDTTSHRSLVSLRQTWRFSPKKSGKK